MAFALRSKKGRWSSDVGTEKGSRPEASTWPRSTSARAWPPSEPGVPTQQHGGDGVAPFLGDDGACRDDRHDRARVGRGHGTDDVGIDRTETQAQAVSTGAVAAHGRSRPVAAQQTLQALLQSGVVRERRKDGEQVGSAKASLSMYSPSSSAV